MNRLNNFFFYLGLFTINAFKYNWRTILIPTAIIGGIASLVVGSAWQLIPSFIGSYLAMIHEEYKQFKKDNQQTTTNE